ncbi:SDR family oxidoreductase [Exiguobacterium sp. s5]|uniref:SDR family NAD(P)-dependent oxidoreductase n=1 Tax=Exiguobacterium sp. s5 TaxID=2751239 RepID=UPI000514121A|nr:SDR family oxidoreductase [Exiguobacterium sp. s5]KGI85565.1 short-chain dehydrogenase [Exiguobacterium mexicanum]
MKQTMIITGVSQGIGRELARHFSTTYRVVGLDIGQDPQLEGVTFHQMDLGDHEDVNSVFKVIHQEVGTAHVLINNGGVSSLVKPMTELDVETFKRVIDVNLVGTFACSKAFLTLNEGADFGRIINVASTRALQNEADWEAYGASKGGIVSLTQSMAVSLAERPITVNAVSPGWIHTSDEALRDIDHAQHPSGRVGTPEDIVRAVSYLIDEKNDFVNGQNLIVDGGMTKKMIYEA